MHGRVIQSCWTCLKRRRGGEPTNGYSPETATSRKPPIPSPASPRPRRFSTAFRSTWPEQQRYPLTLPPRLSRDTSQPRSELYRARSLLMILQRNFLSITLGGAACLLYLFGLNPFFINGVTGHIWRWARLGTSWSPIRSAFVFSDSRLTAAAPH